LESDEAERVPVKRTERRVWFSSLGAVFALLILPAMAIALVIALRRTDPAESSLRVVTSGNVTRAAVGDATLEVGPETEFVAAGNEADGWTVIIERGSVGFAVPERRNRPPFRVLAASTAVEVVGTRFTVLRAGDAVAVNVEHGAVRVTSPNGTKLLHDGEKWGSTAKTTGKTPETVPEPIAAPSESSAPEVDHSAVASTVSSRNRTVASSTSAPQPPSRRDRYEAASRLEGSDPGRAVELYLELAKEADAWGANALFAAGRLEFEKRRYGQAKGLLRRYLLRFPTGLNAEEARTLLERTH
jgi:hypothetical protein